MAKVMISLPDELLAQIDLYARAEHTTRSGAIRTFAEAAFEETNQRIARRMAELSGYAEPRGRDVVADLKAQREERTRSLTQAH